MIEKHVVELLLDEPTKFSGNIYDKEMITSAISTMRNSKLGSYVTLELNEHDVDVFSINLDTITHAIRNLYIDSKKNTVIAELELLNTKSSYIFKKMIKDKTAFLVGPIGTGIVKDNIVSDYTLHRLGIFFD